MGRAACWCSGPCLHPASQGWVPKDRVGWQGSAWVGDLYPLSRPPWHPVPPPGALAPLCHGGRNPGTWLGKLPPVPTSLRGDPSTPWGMFESHGAVQEHEAIPQTSNQGQVPWKTTAQLGHQGFGWQLGWERCWAERSHDLVCFKPGTWETTLGS